MTELTTALIAASLFFGTLGSLIGLAWWSRLHKEPRANYLAAIEGAVATAVLIIVSTTLNRAEMIATALIVLSPSYLVGAFLAYLGAYFTKQESN
jgi:hypothetical protein